MKIKQPKEKDTQKVIMEWLKWNKVFCWKNNNVGIFKKATGTYIPVGMKGVSDIIGILPDGWLLAIEVKRKGKKPTQDQLKFIEEINKRNGVAFVAHNLEEVIIQLRAYT